MGGAENAAKLIIRAILANPLFLRREVDSNIYNGVSVLAFHLQAIASSRVTYSRPFNTKNYVFQRACILSNPISDRLFLSMRKHKNADLYVRFLRHMVNQRKIIIKKYINREFEDISARGKTFKLPEFSSVTQNIAESLVVLNSAATSIVNSTNGRQLVILRHRNVEQSSIIDTLDFPAHHVYIS